MKMPYKTLIVLGLVVSAPYISLAVNKVSGKVTEDRPSVINFVEDAKVKAPRSIKDKINASLKQNSKAPTKLEVVNTGTASYKDRMLERLSGMDE